MQNGLGTDSIELSIYEAEMISDITGVNSMSTAIPVSGTSSNEMDSATISDEAILLASTIVPSIEEQEDYDKFNRLIAVQGGLVGPGGAMINISSIEEPIYAIVKNDLISISGMDAYSYQNAYDIRQTTIRMLEYTQQLIQNVKIEDGSSLQEKLMNMVDSLATLQGEQVGDPNYIQKGESLEDAFRNLTTILIADAARIEYSELPEDDQMILEARSMAEMFNNLLFENLTKSDAKTAFKKAWSAL